MSVLEPPGFLLLSQFLEGGWGHTPGDLYPAQPSILPRATANAAGHLRKCRCYLHTKHEQTGCGQRCRLNYSKSTEYSLAIQVNELLIPATWNGFEGIVKGAVVSEEASPQSPIRVGMPYSGEQVSGWQGLGGGGVGVGLVVLGLF